MLAAGLAKSAFRIHPDRGSAIVRKRVGGSCHWIGGRWLAILGGLNSLRMLVQDFLQRSAATRPDKTALVCGGKRYSYSELNLRAERLAHAFREMGVKRGDRVGMWLNNSVELVIGIFGILKADAVFVSLSRLMKPEKAASLLNDCQAVALITDARAMGQGVGERVKEGAKTVANLVVVGGRARGIVNGHGGLCDFEELTASETSNIQHPTSKEAPNSKLQTSRKLQTSSCNLQSAICNQQSKNIDLDLACLIYTSGTTGESKGVMCDHSNVVFVTQSIVEYLRNSERDITMCVLPLSFSYGLYQLTAMFAVGGTLVLEQSFAFPDLVLEQMAKEHVTGFAGVPTIYSLILSMDLSKYDLSSLRYLTNAAAGLPLDHVKRLRQSFPKADLYLMHGLTEVARTMYLPPSQVDARPASSGIPMPGTELWIEDDEGNRLPAGEIGELVVRGRHVMRGYWNAQELTAKKFRAGRLPGERVCYSGDLFRMDEEGFFYFVSRKDDLIKCRGEKVAPREVENVLYRMSGVLEAAVIGVSDPIMGQVVKAFIVAPGATLSEVDVISHCKANLEEFMVPRMVEFRSELPKTSSGKIRKVELS
jgi:long-chain acyl-CoA synthetase